jgi:hypothetical protein
MACEKLSATRCGKNLAQNVSFTSSPNQQVLAAAVVFASSKMPLIAGLGYRLRASP